MLKFFSIIFIHLLLVTTLHSQSFNQRLNPLIDTYKSFDYQDTIDKANKLLADSAGLNKADLCEIHRLKAISYYSLSNMQGSLKSFVAILKIDPKYTLSPEENSPKIIAFFEEIRLNFLPSPTDYQPQKMVPDTLLLTQKIDTIAMAPSISNKTLLYSFLVPGLGHITTDPSPKSWLLFSASMVMLGSSVYYIIDTNQKENDYLKAVEKSEIESKYIAYNTSYKRRNFFIITYAVLWLYSHLDILVFSQRENHKEPNFSFNMSIHRPDQHMITMCIIF